MNYQNRRIKNNEDDQEDDFPFGKQQLGFFERSIKATQITLYLDEHIQEPMYYRNVLNRIHNMGQQDELDIVINSPGGRLDSAISLINAIRFTEGNVTGIIDNQAHSAASMILLSCPNIFVAPNSSMMLHSYSTGIVGKSNEIMANAAFNDAEIKKLMAEIYLGFLNEKELGQLFNGTDFWMNSEEITQRLEARNKYFQKMQRKAELDAKPKKPSKPKTVPKPEYDPADVALTKAMIEGTGAEGFVQEFEKQLTKPKRERKAKP